MKFDATTTSSLSAGNTITSTVTSHRKYWNSVVIMAALSNRAGHYIFAPWFLSSIFYLSIFLFFPRLISAAAGWMSTIL